MWITGEETRGTETRRRKEETSRKKRRVLLNVKIGTATPRELGTWQKWEETNTPAIPIRIGFGQSSNLKSSCYNCLLESTEVMEEWESMLSRWVVSIIGERSNNARCISDTSLENQAKQPRLVTETLLVHLLAVFVHTNPVSAKNYSPTMPGEKTFRSWSFEKQARFYDLIVQTAEQLGSTLVDWLIGTCRCWSVFYGYSAHWHPPVWRNRHEQPLSHVLHEQSETSTTLATSECLLERCQRSSQIYHDKELSVHGLLREIWSLAHHFVALDAGWLYPPW